MAGIQSLEENGVTKGSAVNLKELNVDDLKRLIAFQQRDIALKNDRLRGVEKLTAICSDLEEKFQSERTKSENYEKALRRSEAKIAYLNKKLGIGPQTSFDIDVINPGVSRKDFDAVTKENIRLKEALEHIVPTELGGKDIAIKNKELYELVTTLQDDLARREHHIKELENTLNCSNKDDLVVKVNELNMKFDRSMQDFSEKLTKIVDQVVASPHMVHGGKDIADGQAADENNIASGPTSNDENLSMESKTAKFGSSDNVDLKQSLVPNVLDGKDSVATDKAYPESSNVFNENLLEPIEIDRDKEIPSLKRNVETSQGQVADKDVDAAGFPCPIQEQATDDATKNKKEVKEEEEIEKEEKAGRCDEKLCPVTINISGGSFTNCSFGAVSK